MREKHHNLRVFVAVLYMSSTALLASSDKDFESVVVTATRSRAVVGDQPIRVEALPEEEIEENSTVQPGNLTTLLNELAGIRMQSTAPGLAGASLRMRGLPGRHTQVLSDGLPLLGAAPDGFGLLQVPPLDLARVEVIKGVASALYGGAALGGVLNLISRAPAQESELLLNRASTGGEDIAGFTSNRVSDKLGYTLTGGIHHHRRADIDHDGWAELPRYQRYMIRPRLLYQASENDFLFATIGAMHEDRVGGSMPGQTLFDDTTFIQSLRTTRIDAGLVGQRTVVDDVLLGSRVSATTSNHARQFDALLSEDRQSTLSAELTLLGELSQHAWLVGAAVLYDRLDAVHTPRAQYAYTTPAIFIQDEFSPFTWLSAAVSARVDAHSEFGSFYSPRLSLLFKPAQRWRIRTSLGKGFASPTPLIDELESTGLNVLDLSSPLKPERARSGSVDVQWMLSRWELNVSAFASEIEDPLRVNTMNSGRLQVVNQDHSARVRGAEALARYVSGPLRMFGSYTYLHATEHENGEVRRRAELVPRHAAELAVMLESEERGRVCIELTYTGTQHLKDNPYRTRGRSYLEIDFLAEIKFGDIAVFFNAINLTDVRQSDFDPLLRPTPSLVNERITDIWAPLAGRVFNLGVKIEY